MTPANFDSWLKCHSPEPPLSLRSIMTKLDQQEGKRLKPAALKAYIEWAQDNAGCCCHFAAPCSSCTHPGNPMNLKDDPDAWEPETIDLDEMVADAMAAVANNIKAHSWLHQYQIKARSIYYNAFKMQGLEPGSKWFYHDPGNPLPKTFRSKNPIRYEY